MTAWDVLERHFDGMTADEVDAELAAVPVPGATPVGAEAAAYLAEHGGPELDGEPRSAGDVHRRRSLTAARTLSETLRATLTLEEAAKRLGLSRSRVSHRLKDQSLWAFTVQGRRYLPQWQFTGGHLIPGLAQVVPAIPVSVHPLAVAAFMTTANDEFDGESPVEWLTSGGDPAPIVDWLTGMGHG